MRATEKFAVLGRDAVDGLANDPRPTATGRCRDAATGKYHHVRLFVMTLAYSRKAVRLLTANSSAKTWAQLHEWAFRRLGGAVQWVVFDNLHEGVLKPDVYEPCLTGPLPA